MGDENRQDKRTDHLENDKFSKDCVINRKWIVVTPSH